MSRQDFNRLNHLLDNQSRLISTGSTRRVESPGRVHRDLIETRRVESPGRVYRDLIETRRVEFIETLSRPSRSVMAGKQLRFSTNVLRGDIMRFFVKSGQCLWRKDATTNAQTNNSAFGRGSSHDTRRYPVYSEQRARHTNYRRSAKRRPHQKTGYKTSPTNLAFGLDYAQPLACRTRKMGKRKLSPDNHARSNCP